MYIDINNLSGRPFVFDRRFRLSEESPAGNDGVEVGEVHLRGQAIQSPGGVDFQATLDAALRLRCSRCLEMYGTAVSSPISLIIVAEAVELEVGEFQLSVEDLKLFHATAGKVELEAIAREYVYLSVPLKPICGEPCQGLCPTCGANRNRLECGCPSENLDPRLAPLLDLKKRLGDS